MATPKPTFFLNLPITSLPASKTFYTALGFTPVEAWSDSETAAFLFPAPNQGVSLMLYSHTRFKQFLRPGGGAAIADARTTTEALFSVMRKTTKAVDEWLERVEDAGGKRDPYVMEGFGAGMGMYCRSWEDLDGHVWEVIAMLRMESEGGKAS